MNHEFINPNYHVILIHAPLGLLIFGTVIELFSFLWPRSSARSAGRWMILLGALASAPTALSGLYAMWDVNAPGAIGNEATWAEIRAESPVQGEAWEMMQDHAWLNGGAAVGTLLLVTVWLAFSDAWRRRLHVLFLAVLVGMVITVTIGAWHGGEMIYRHGVGHTSGHSDGHDASAPAAQSHDETMPATQAEAKNTFEKVAYFFPPLQMHVMMAGAAIAIAFAALGLSLRGTTKVIVDTQPPMDVDMGSIAGAFDPRPAALRRTEDFDGPREVIVRVPSARWWLLMSFFALLTAAGGVVVLGYYSDTTDPRHLYDIVIDRPLGEPPLTRRIVHVGLGVTIVVVPLLLALLARFASKQRLLIGIFGLILLAAAGAQVWIGTLLMLDSPIGTIKAFNGSESSHEGGTTTAPTTQATG